MDNPAFGNGEGESSASSGGSEVGGDTQAEESGSEASSTQGEVGTDTSSEVDTGMSDTTDASSTTEGGDGDDSSELTTDAGSGDGDAGDGDTGETPCELLELPVIADTWLVSGPQEGDPPNCLLGDAYWGPDGIACAHLNFGATHGLWLGEQVSGEGVSVMLLEFDPAAVLDAGTIATVESAELHLFVEATNTLPTDTIVWANLMPPGDGYDWAEGELDALEPSADAGVSTFAYQYFKSTPWPNATPFPLSPIDFGGSNISGQAGDFELIMGVDTTLTAQWFGDNLSTGMENGIMVGSNAAPFGLLAFSRESGAQAHLDISVCY